MATPHLTRCRARAGAAGLCTCAVTLGRRSREAAECQAQAPQAVFGKGLHERIRRLAVLRQSPCYIGVRKHGPRLARVDGSR